MTRVEFTFAIGKLLVDMHLKGERVLIDWVKRSAEDQLRFYNEGKSKCDGVTKVSAHQRGRAADIYFLTEDGKGLTDPVKGWVYWHRRWEEFGGKPMISWDKGHFEG